MVKLVFYNLGYIKDLIVGSKCHSAVMLIGWITTLWYKEEKEVKGGIIYK